jgi:hypothetical protein|tara:strand:+ start:3356 stop:3682 length:327 start_codon:yes stop_codon:yes gene_type:complete
MASIINFSIDLNKIPKDKIIIGKKGKYLPLTLTINDEVDNYGNQGPVIVAMSKEEREAGAEKLYLGNAKVIWTNGTNVERAPFQENGTPAPGVTLAATPAAIDDDLPF